MTRVDYKRLEEDNIIIEDILTVMSSSRTAFVTMHARPDGDAMGASLALNALLEKTGIETKIISPSPVPHIYDFMHGIENVIEVMPDKVSDIGFVLDCSDSTRLESMQPILEKARTIVNIDHHQVYQNFGDINFIRPESSSTSELIYKLILNSGIEIDETMAQGIYVGIVTDTNRFQEDNTSPMTHKIASDLIDFGISPIEISSNIYCRRRPSELKLLARALETIEISAGGNIASITVTPEDMRSTSTSTEDLEGIINFARSIDGVEVGALFRKIPGVNGVKVSFRSKGKIDVGKFAKRYRGGGHHNASGCSIEGDFTEVKKLVISELEELMKSELERDS